MPSTSLVPAAAAATPTGAADFVLDCTASQAGALQATPRQELQPECGTYGNKLLCAIGSKASVCTIQTAGHVAAILHCMLAHGSAALDVCMPRTLVTVLSSLALVCPAAACVFAPLSSAAGQERAAAAAAAAVEMLQLGTQLLQHMRLPADKMRDALFEVKSYAMLDLSVAVAHVLQPGAQVPEALRRSAARFLARMLASVEHATPFLHSWVDGSEWTCSSVLVPPPLQATDTPGTIPVGRALIAGLLRERRESKARPALADMGNLATTAASLDCKIDCPSKAVPPLCFAVQALLSRSTAAKFYAIAHGMPACWAENASAALKSLVSLSENGRVCT